jgi:hypothetical protein
MPTKATKPAPRERDIHWHECENWKCPAIMSNHAGNKIRRGHDGGRIWRHDGNKQRTPEESAQAHLCPSCGKEQLMRYEPFVQSRYS